MKIIDGQDLKRLFISGSNNLYNHYPEVDALNVFPVPDGDTGMNMNLTMTSGSKEIQNRSDKNVYDIAKTFSRGLLMGARGNSGVITSQIFRGFSIGLEGKDEINAVDFSNALQKGVEVAYKAVIRPVEGTILTVVKDSSQYLANHVKEGMSFEKAFELLLKEAKESLKRTPDLLPILKEVGVVDSGGTGLIYIFEGMAAALDGEIIERNEATSTDADNPIVAAGAAMDEEEFGYCTEFIMSLGPDSVKKPFNEKRFTTIVGSHGNSLVVVHDDDIVKVHVHTLNPGNVLNYAQQFGEFLKIKIENMTEQHHALANGAQVEEHVDLVPEPEEKKEKEKFGMIAVSAGEGISEVFTEIGVKQIVTGGQTMNPSAEDFLQAIKATNAKNVFIFPNNSNILLAATQAKDMNEDTDIQNIYVIPSKTIPQGISASLCFNEEMDADEIFEEMKASLHNVKSGEVTFAIRDTELNGVSIKKDEFMGIFEKDIVVSNPDKFAALYALLEEMVDEDSSLITIFCGEDIKEADIEKIQSHLEEKYDELDIDIRQGNQPVYSFIIGVE